MLSVAELRPHVWHIEFERAYDCAMGFLRFQEWAESPKYRRRFFTLAEYAEWYARTHGRDPDDSDDLSGAFTYPADWSGFNIPSECVRALLGAPPSSAFPDENHHDRLMCALLREVERREDGARYYVLGTSAERPGALEHEIAHALYYVEPGYRETADRLLGQLEAHVVGPLRSYLEAAGYHPDVVADEMHAYLATGPVAEMRDVIGEVTWNNRAERFRRLFVDWTDGPDSGCGVES